MGIGRDSFEDEERHCWAVRIKTCGRALKIPPKLILYLISVESLVWILWITRRKQVRGGLVGRRVCLI